MRPCKRASYIPILLMLCGYVENIIKREGTGEEKILNYCCSNTRRVEGGKKNFRVKYNIIYKRV